MTNYEKNIIKNKDFAFIWKYLWGEQAGLQYRGEENKSYHKFSTLKNGLIDNLTNEYYNIDTFINESDTNWGGTRMGISKGRRNYNEKDIMCALREFEEETGYKKTMYVLIQNILPIEEIFTGSILKSYKHKYFIGYIDTNEISNNNYQKNEVSKINWKYIDDAIDSIRDYNLEKKKIY